MLEKWMTIKEKTRLIVFDVEGVLIPRNMFFFQAGRTIGFFALIQILLYRLLYEVGIFSLEVSLKHIFRKLKGQKMETLQQIFNQIPATARLQDFFLQTKEQGNYKVALISSCLPSVIVKQFAVWLNADYAYGIDVCVNERGEVTGEISGEVREVNGKKKILHQILVKEGLTLRDCTIVARDRNNCCIYTKEVKKIGYNPNFIIRIKSDHVIMGKLSNVLPILKDKKSKWTAPSVNDLVRENIHAAGIFTPIITQIIGLLPVVIFISVLSIIYLISELARLNGKNLPFISTITRHAASQSELYGFAAAPLFYALGILFTLLIFPFPVSTAAIAIFTLGDSVASIFGGSIGIRLPFNKGKTLEGSFSGFVCAFLVSCLFVAPWIAVIGAAIAMFVEYLPLPINDNVLIPIVTAAVLMLLI
jgi:dolichol kinase/phosphoserine phosphatase